MRRIIHTAACLLLTALCASTLAEVEQSHNGEIGKTIDALDAAEEAGNLQKYLSLWHEDSVQMFNGSPDYVGKAAIAAAMGDFLASYSIKVDSQIVDISVDGHLAFVRSNAKLTITPKNGAEVIKQDIRIFLVLKKNADNQWRFWREVSI